MDERRMRTTPTAAEVEAELSVRERSIVQIVGKLTLVSSQQITRLCFGSEGVSASKRRARWTLRRLTELGVLARLQRRVGGARAGSDGFVYRLGPQGHRLVLWWATGTDSRARSLPDPGERFVRHRLVASDMYVRLAEAAGQARANGLELLGFEAEPECWRHYVAEYSGVRLILKPDAFVRVGVGRLERWWFCEFDLGTVGRRTRETQANAYRAYWRSGAAGEVMPKVLWLTPNELVSDRVRDAIRPWREPHGLFVIASLADAVTVATEPVTEEQE